MSRSSRLANILATLSSLGATTVAGPGDAGDVKVVGLHLCCQACTKAVEGALVAAGVSDLTIDRQAGGAAFKADDPERALRALEDAGFHGRVDGRTPPEAEAEGKERGRAGPVAKSFRITGAHLCCGRCQREIVAAIRAVAGVATVEIEDGVVTVTAKAQGQGIRPCEVIDAIHEAGFHGRVEDARE